MSEVSTETILHALAQDIPDVGDTFTATIPFDTKPRRWRVSCWLKRYERPPMAERVAKFPEHIREDMAEMLIKMDAKYPLAGHGPDKVPLMFCTRWEAEYVEGVEACGWIFRVSDIRVTGRVPWSAELIESGREHANMIAGERLV